MTSLSSSSGLLNLLRSAKMGSMSCPAENLEAKYGKVKTQHAPCGDETQELSNAVLLPLDEVFLYRSQVAIGGQCHLFV